jgi:hypothetical protein
MTTPFDPPEPVLPEPFLPAKIDETGTDRDRRRRRSVVLSVTTVVLVGVIVLLIDDPFTSTARMTPTQRVIAAEKAVSKQSAFTYKMSGSELETSGSSLQVGSNPAIISGSGAIDKVSGSAKVIYTVKVASSSITVREVLSAKSEYIDSPALAPYLPKGKTWVKIPATLLNSKAVLSDFSSTPALAKILKAREAKVDDAGPGSVDGTPVELYRLTFDRAATIELGGLVAEKGSSVVPGSWVYMFAIDHANAVRQIQESVVDATSTTQVHVHLTFDITRYGLPVNVSPPSEHKVDSLNAAQFKQLEQQSRSAPPSLV